MDLPRGEGLGAGLKRAWAFLRESVALAGRKTVVLAPSLLSALSSLALIGLYLLVVYLVQGDLSRHSHHDSHEPFLKYLGALIGFAALLMSFWFMGMTADLVSAVLRGQPATLGHAWNEACRNGLALVWLALVTMAVNAVTGSARRRGGVMGGVMGDAVEAGWRVAAHLLVPIVILEDIPLSQAFQRAIRLHNSNIIGIIVGEVAVSWLTGAISFIVILGAAAGGFFAYQVLPATLPLLIAAWAGILLVMVAGVGYVRMAYYTCLYEWAVACERAGEVVPAPAPLAAALARA